MNKTNLQFLSLYSLFLKVMSIMSIFGGLISIGVFIYLWGRIKAFYDMLQTAIDGFAALAELGMPNTIPQLPDFPIWPLLLILLFTFAFIIIIALTLWAISAYVDIHLDIIQKEIRQRVLLLEKLDTMSQEFNVVSHHFRSLTQKQQKQ